MRDWKELVRARLGDLPVDPMRAADIVEELAQHAAEHFSELVAAGTPESDALATVLAPLADPAHVAAEIARADRPRQVAPTPPPSAGVSAAGIVRDIRYAIRMLRRSPAFATTAIVTLALGIGANAAIFTVLHAVLLQPLPYASAERLVAIGGTSRSGSPGNVGYSTIADWRARTHSFDSIAIIRSWSPTLVAGGEPERVNAVRVSANFFRTLGVAPALGSDFAERDDTPAGWRVLILSDGLWRRRFNADRSVVGRIVTMNDQPFTIAGVMPASFEPLISEHYYRRAEMWALLGYERTQPAACRTCQHLKVIARLKAQVPLARAAADVAAVQTELRREYPREYSSDAVAVVRLGDELTGHIRPVLTLLMGAVAFVLLIGCANVANLLLARMANRDRDLALRAALGAARWQLIRQMLAESGVLALAGGAIGVAFAAAAIPILTHTAPDAMARIADARLNAPVLGFSLALSLVTALLFGLLPAMRASRLDLRESLHGEGRRTASAPTSVLRRALIAADVAMAMVLLIGAGLMIRSVGRLLAVDPGFDPDGVLTLQISLGGASYATNEAVVAKTDEIVSRLRALPGVEAAAAASQIPLGGNGDTWGFHVEGRAPGPEDPNVERYAVTPEYFRAMRLRLVRGRSFTAADDARAEPVILIGDATARAVWPGENPLGRRVRIGGYDGPWRTIVGIVGDVRHQELASPPTLQMYVPHAQFADSFLTIVLRTRGDPGALAGAARAAIWSVAKEVPIVDIAPLTAVVERSVGPRRFVMVLLEAFSLIALLMTAVGVYGVISYSVAERTREIGIRAALGASPGDIVRLIVGGGMVVVLIGIAVGGAGGLAATRLLAGSLFEVSATDPATFAIVPAVLLAVALAAQVVPIARAMRVDPTVALRQE